MKLELRAFHVGDGDCLLLSASDINILIDGGRSGAFKRYAAPYIYDPNNVPQLDLLVVSHIDDDHVSGILRILKDKVKHKVWAVKKAAGRTAGMPRTEPVNPPEIAKVWHNPVEDHFGESVAATAGASIATSAALLGGSRTAMFGESAAAGQAAKLDNLATGFRSAVELQGRAAGQLGIMSEPQILDEAAPENSVCTEYDPFKITVIGPSKRRIEDLAEEWQEWVEENESQREKLMERLKADEEQMGEISASALSPDGIALGGGGSHISVPNLASLMMMVECDSRTILLTGDGSAEDILDGLEATGFLDLESTMHIDVLKVPHHGAAANVTDQLCERVTADHYVFCGNGAHTNPELEVLRQIVESRVTEAGDETSAPFTFWFTTDSATDGLSDSRKAHMAAVEAEMVLLAETAPVTSEFLDVNKTEEESGQGAHLLIDLSS